VKRPSPKTLVVLTTILVLFALGVAWLARPERVPVEVATVERGRVEETATNSRAGTVEARRRAKLSPEIGGRVTAIPHAEGERVERGDVLLELDPALERGEVTLRRRELEATRAEAERACLAASRAGRELERQRRLAAERLVAEDALDRFASAALEADAAGAAARAGAESAAAGLELARATLDKRTLRAPFDGVVARVAIELGEWTTPSPPALPVPPVIDVLDPDSIYVELPMDEVDAGRLRVGLPARVTIDSHPGRTFAGTVVRVASYVLDVEAQNRTVEIEVDLDEPPAGVLPGTSADVEVLLDTRDAVLRVPTSAVLAGDRVLVVEGDVLAERAVETGLRNWDFVEIVAGLEAGERVVTSLDRAEVRAGARVVVEAGDAAGAGPP
jgi:HlyD family secretion protein